MPWCEQWTITGAPDLDARAIAAVVEEALAARGLTIGPAIVHEGGELEGVRLECFGRYVAIGLGLGELRGTITVARADGDDPAYIGFHSDAVAGPWEPLYALFAELGGALGAAQEPALPAALAALDPGELREDVRATVDACVSDAMYGGGLGSVDATIEEVDAGGAGPARGGAGPALGEPALELTGGLEIELGGDALAVRVTGAGARFVVRARGFGPGLSADGRAALERALREDLQACIAAHRWLRHRGLAPPADPARAGRLFLERRDGGRLISAEELTDLAALRDALAAHDADVIRYFGTGAPFWKASYQRGHALDALVQSLDDLHSDRTWQWDAAAPATTG